MSTEVQNHDHHTHPIDPASLTRELTDEHGSPLPKHRSGAEVTGIYPHVSRTKLAEAMGKHISTVSKYLNGGRKMSLGVAVELAGLIGVGVEELEREVRGLGVGDGGRYREQEREKRRAGRSGGRSGRKRKGAKGR